MRCSRSCSPKSRRGRDRSSAVRRGAVAAGGLASEWAAIAAKRGAAAPETLRKWVRPAEVDGRQRPGVTTAERERLVQPERENREPRRANEILRAAAAFFAGARPAPAAAVSFIAAHKGRWGVEPICRALRVAPSTYDAATTRPPAEVEAIHDHQATPARLSLYKTRGGSVDRDGFTELRKCQALVGALPVGA